MNKLYSHLRSEIDKMNLSGSSALKLNFYKILLGISKYIIILISGSGNAFPLIFQIQGSQSVTFSYKEFKAYQKKIRFVCIVIVILSLVIFKVK